MRRLRHISKLDRPRGTLDQELVDIVNHNKDIRLGDNKEEDLDLSSNKDIDRPRGRHISKVLLELGLNNRISMDQDLDLDNNHTPHLIQVVRLLIDITHPIHRLPWPCRRIDHISHNPCLVLNLEDLVRL